MSEEAAARCCAFLSELGIVFERFDHPAVFTVEQGETLLAHVPGAGTKNLFLRDKSGRTHFLLTVPEKKQVDLKTLANSLGMSRLSFASADSLIRYLGVEPGSVTLLGLMNDTEKNVKFLIDQDLLLHDRWQMHPLTNQATLVLKRSDVEHFVISTGHTWSVLSVASL